MISLLTQKIFRVRHTDSVFLIELIELMLINIFQNNSAVRTLKWKEIMEEFFACVADRVISSIQSHIELSKLENMQTKTPQKTKYSFDK